MTIAINSLPFNWNIFQDKPSFSRTTSLSHAREVEEAKQVSQMYKVSTPNSTRSQSQPPSQTMGTDSPVSSHTSEYEDAESGAVLVATPIICYASSGSTRNYQVHALKFSLHCRISKANFDAADNYQATSRYHPFTEMRQHDDRWIILLIFRPCVTTPGRLGELQFWIFLRVAWISPGHFQGI